ncbi:MAG: hypothetical protein IGS03_14105 [Candidatus Sericytochromatia bacterium]|nr:hypothetical protein [Candidatus Sericytochromatia bacterium]
MAENTRERDLVLAPNEFAFISDQTKGNINVYVGPYKTSLANTDQPVSFDTRSKRFCGCNLEAATGIFATAPEGWYLTLKNPARDGQQPKTGTVNSLAELEIGHKVHLPGPVSLALWPGQMCRVLQGHALRSNQYLVVRVYDEQAARQNWAAAVVKPQRAEEPEPEDTITALVPTLTPHLTLGQELVIQGTEVSFYIPPTGVEVLPDAAGDYVREAVTLERLEYCILLDEDGQKRYIQGPAVVFPRPTERFVSQQGQRKFRALELNENAGLYLKVIAPYSENGRDYKVGDELFLTGKSQMIYFPRPEHAIIRYGEQTIHYAVAIPAGEGRYLLDRHSGQIRLVSGPAMLLPDPRREVIVRRVLEPGQVRLWFPGNAEALAYNQTLQDQLHGDYAEEAQVRKLLKKSRQQAEPEAPSAEAGLLPADDFNRRTAYTPPRTITLNTKYDGAVAISVWTGYAVLVVSKSGERKVLTGPCNVLLAYDEVLEPVSLSTGLPKSSEHLLRTAYLRSLHNKISDQITVETQDLCRLNLQLSYRVNFTGDPQRWFAVENYVGFLCEHLRSMLRSAVRQLPIETFYARATEILRDLILGPSEDGQRPGRRFEENGMLIYDVEVLDVSLQDPEVEALLLRSQRAVVEQNLHLAAERRRLQQVQAEENIQREIAATQAESQLLAIARQMDQAREEAARQQAQLQQQAAQEQLRLKASLDNQELLAAVHSAELARQRERQQAELALAQAQLEQRLAELQAEVAAVVAKAEAISPDLIAALQAFGDKALAERMAESMAPLAILGGTSVADVLHQLLRGTRLQDLMLSAVE